MPSVRLHLIDEAGRVPSWSEPLAGMAADMAERTGKYYGHVGFAPPFVGYLVEEGGTLIGSAGFKGGPKEGRVEIAYVTFPEFEGRGVATATASALLAIVDRSPEGPEVFAQTLPANAASGRILTKLGFAVTAELEDPEHGAILEWTRGQGNSELGAEPPELSTERLRLRPLVADDAEFVLSLLNEPGWGRWIGDAGVRDDAAAAAYIEARRASYRQQGYGLLHVSEQGRPVGLCGILRRATLAEPDLGFAFFDAEAGRGLATESSRAVLQDADHRLALTEVLAITRPDHAAARRVLEKLDFDFCGEIDMRGERLALARRSRS